MTPRAAEIGLRPAGPGDIEAIRSLLLETWLATYGRFIPEVDIRRFHATAYSAGAVEERMGRPGVLFTLAKEGDAPAGVMITTVVPHERRLAVSSLYVAPAMQGRGIGSRLIQEIEAHKRTDAELQRAGHAVVEGREGQGPGT